MKNDYLVVKSNSLINATSKHKYSTNELKIIAHLIANIKPKDNDFNKNVINIKNIVGHNSNLNSKYLDELTDNLMSKPFYVLGEDGKKHKYNWFTKLSYDNSTITYEFHNDLIPFLLNLKNNFTEYYLSNILNLKSSYSIRLYELLKQFQNLGYRRVLIEDLREVLQIPKSYKNNDIKRMLDNVQEDLKESTDLTFKYEIEKLGRKFHSINFSIIRIKNRIISFEDSSSLKDKMSKL